MYMTHRVIQVGAGRPSALSEGLADQEIMFNMFMQVLLGKTPACEI